jgi:hypothetical protein
VIKEELSVQPAIGEMMKAEEPRWRTLSKEPSLTEAAVPAEIAAAIAEPPSGGSVRASRRTPAEARKAILASQALAKDKEDGLTSSAAMEGSWEPE